MLLREKTSVARENTFDMALLKECSISRHRSINIALLRSGVFGSASLTNRKWSNLHWNVVPRRFPQARSNNQSLQE